MKTKTNDIINLTLNPQYLRQRKSLLFSKTEVRIVFKAGPNFEGPLEKLPAFTKGRDLSFRDSTIKGSKVAVFPTFIPSNKAQRAYLAKKLGTEVNSNDCFTFATLWTARQFARELKQEGIKFKPSNFGYGVTDPKAAPTPAPNKEADIPL